MYCVIIAASQHSRLSYFSIFFRSTLTSTASVYLAYCKLSGTLPKISGKSVQPTTTLYSETKVINRKMDEMMDGEGDVCITNEMSDKK